MEETASYYISLISVASNHYGNHLLSLMDEYGVMCLMVITQEQAKAYYNKYIGVKYNGK